MKLISQNQILPDLISSSNLSEVCQGKANSNKLLGFSEESVGYETTQREMRLRNYSHKTIKSYLNLKTFVVYIQPKSPREVTDEYTREYLLHLIERKKFYASYINLAREIAENLESALEQFNSIKEEFEKNL